MVVEILSAVVLAGGVWLASSVRVVKQYERGLIYRFGRVKSRVREPGLAVLVPFADRLQKEKPLPIAEAVRAAVAGHEPFAADGVLAGVAAAEQQAAEELAALAADVSRAVGMP